eukprot:CAMPEP_0175092832 /NCGR_PEP_ID=MMETSP0086_2-20121207/2674_1 /TAXON_ID=136419 /ORGANISM="Unknown Unknown, Strain D1" /LENGTH=652 /DNA_ID=CAMNT_0016365723 /DNA_START=32 /DNA_END=1990 /DNA_ORIENTATION=-
MTEIETKRSCTDILPLLAFLASWGLLAFIQITAQNNGADPNKIIYGVNAKGQICGVTEGVKDKPLAAFPYVDFSLSNPTSNWHHLVVCVKDCSVTNGSDMTTANQFSTLYNSSKFLSYCLPVPASDVSISVSGNLNSQIATGFETAAKAITDINTSQDVIFGSAALAFLFIFFWLVALRKCAKTMVYLLLFCIAGGGMMLSQLFLEWAKDMEVKQAAAESMGDVQYLRWAGYLFMALTTIFLLVVFFLRTQIDIAIEVTRESAKALLDMKWLAVFPLLPAILVILYLVLWVFIGLNMYSLTTTVSEPTLNASRTYGLTWLAKNPLQVNSINSNIPANITRYQIDTSLQWASVFHLFHMFWVTQFFFYLGFLIFAGAAADWYFTKTDAEGHKRRGHETAELSHFPVQHSFCRTIRYHLGTVATTSAIIATVKTVRALVLYLERQTKGEPPNKLQQALFCMLHCYLKCVECCLDKINKNALVWTAVYGDGFCVSCCSSFALVWRNLFRVAALHTVSVIIFFMGKCSVGLCVGGLVALFLMHVDPFKTTLSSPLAPALVSFALAYVISGLFFIMLDSIIDTIFLCFLIDSEVNSKGQMMATPALQKLVGKYSKRSHDMAHEWKSHRHDRPHDGVDDFHPDADGHGQEMNRLHDHD